MLCTFRTSFGACILHSRPGQYNDSKCVFFSSTASVRLSFGIPLARACVSAGDCSCIAIYVSRPSFVRASRLRRLCSRYGNERRIRIPLSYRTRMIPLSMSSPPNDSAWMKYSFPYNNRVDLWSACVHARGRPLYMLSSLVWNLSEAASASKT